MLAGRLVLRALPRRLLAEGPRRLPPSRLSALRTPAADAAGPRRSCPCCCPGPSHACGARPSSTLSAAAAAPDPAGAEAPVKPSMELLSKLRKETQVSMGKAREALVVSRNDYSAALSWVQEDALKSGAKKVEKLAAKVAAEGVVSIVVTGGDGGWGDKMSVVELCCETDFVSRNQSFRAFAARIATAALVLEGDTSSRIRHVLPERVLTAPLLPPASADALNSGRVLSVREGVADLVGKLGENIKLRRFAVAGAGSVADPSVMVATYIHGGESTAFGNTAFVHTGRIAGAVLLRLRAPSIDPRMREAVGVLAKKIARQVVGFQPMFLSERHIVEKPEALEGPALDEWMSENVLTHQTLFGGEDGETVARAVERISQSFADEGLRVELVDFLRFEAGEGIEKPVIDFAEEVKAAAATA